MEAKLSDSRQKFQIIHALFSRDFFEFRTFTKWMYRISLNRMEVNFIAKIFGKLPNKYILACILYARFH